MDDISCSSAIDPFHPQCYAGLNLYPSLNVLQLGVQQKAFGVSKDESKAMFLRQYLSEDGVKINNTVSQLIIHGDLDKFEASIPRFLQHFINLRSLSIAEKCGRLDINRALESVSKEIRYLSIENYGREEGGPSEYVELDQLSTFLPHLTSLSLHTYAVDDTLCLSLKNFEELQSIEIGGEARPSFSGFGFLLFQDSRPPKLHYLTLDHIAGQEGEDFNHLNDIPIDVFIGYQWELPEWYDTFTFNDALVLQRLASHLDIHLYGAINEAIDVQFAFDGQKRSLEERNRLTSEALESAHVLLEAMGERTCRSD